MLNTTKSIYFQLGSVFPLPEFVINLLCLSDATLLTFQLLKSWLKDTDLKNIPCILVTLETFQLDKSELNLYASSNISSMLVTLETSHFDRSALKLDE